MREIKFRAWDSIRNRFLLPKEFAVKPDGGWGGFNAGFILEPDQYQPDSLFEICGEFNNSKEKQSSITLMQYTGLKDKNGKEIYEGDILRIGPQGEERNATIAEVVFREGSFVAEYYFQFILFSKVVVLGNIYKNPDLFNAQSKPTGS